MDENRVGEDANVELNEIESNAEIQDKLLNLNSSALVLDTNTCINDRNKQQISEACPLIDHSHDSVTAPEDMLQQNISNNVTDESRNIQKEQTNLPTSQNGDAKLNIDIINQPCDRDMPIETMADRRRTNDKVMHSETCRDDKDIQSETCRDGVPERVSANEICAGNANIEDRLSPVNIVDAASCGCHEPNVDIYKHAGDTSIQTHHKAKNSDSVKQSGSVSDLNVEHQNRLTRSDTDVNMIGRTNSNVNIRNDNEQNNREYENVTQRLWENGNCKNSKYDEDMSKQANENNNNKRHGNSNSCSKSRSYNTDSDGDKDTLLNGNTINDDAYSIASDGELKEALLTSFPSELVLDKELEINRSVLSQSFIMPYSSQDKYTLGKGDTEYSIAYKNEKNHQLSLSKDLKQISDSPKPSAVDSSWSYVVAVASFISQVLLGGHVYTGGLFYTIFRYEFPNTSRVALSWMCALPLTMWFGGGLFGSIICNRYGPRVCALFGGILAGVGLSLCYLTTNFYILFICYGIVAGSGYGIQYVGFITSVNFYCKKHRSLVTILTTLGPTFGMSLYSFLVPYLYTLYSWTGALLILGALALNLCACATVLFPIETRPQARKLFNISVLNEKYFALFCSTCVVATMTNGMTILHLPSLIISFDLGTVAASMALMLFGVANCGAKIVFAGCGHFMQMDVAKIYFGSFVGCAIASVLLPVMKYEEWVLVFVSMIGAAYCVLGGHYIEMVYELVGPEKFSDAIGIAQFAKATGTIMSGPVCGFLYQATGSYQMTFYTNTGLLCLVCVLLVPILLKRRRVNLARATEYTIKDPFLDDEP